MADASNPNLLPIDQHFARLLCRKGADQSLFPVFVKLSQTMQKQNSCLIVTDDEVLTQLKSANCVTAIAAVDLSRTDAIQTPLVLVMTTDDTGYLYTQRYYQYESRIATQIIARNQRAPDAEASAKAVQIYLTEQDDPLQIVAATQAALRQFTIITGGPGTGKTSTVLKIVAGLIKANPALRLRMAAPTGKAAMRLSESIESAAGRLGVSVPSDVKTLHRLLGVYGDGRHFQYHPGNQLPLDVLILDEASMIDLAMFDRLLAALPESSRLILLGDPYQLPSVDSGNVLGDLTQQGVVYSEATRAEIMSHCQQSVPTGAKDHRLVDSHAALKTSYRFKDDAGIGQLARWLRTEHSEDTGAEIDLEAASRGDEVTITSGFEPPDVLTAMTSLYADYLSACRAQADALELLDQFEAARLLTPVKEGDYGVNHLNQTFEDRHFPDTETYYHGKPIMIEQNHYALRLFNGDVGICVERASGIEVAFKNSSGELEYFLPSRLPQHKTCFAMTVHKSQGSEFDRVCLVLPEIKEEFISREMIYTGVTRCKQHLHLLTNIDLAKTKNHQRISGLHLRFS